MRLIIALLACCTCLTAGETYNDAAERDRPMLGVQMRPLSLRVATDQGLQPGDGVLVQRVFNGTAASSMGIQPGDVITRINGRPITSMTALRDVVQGSGVGEPVTVSVRRDGKDVSMQPTTLRQWPQDVPYQDIDRRSEERYVQHQLAMQRRQAEVNSNRNAGLDDLRRQNADLDRALAEAGQPGNPSGLPGNRPQNPGGLPSAMDAARQQLTRAKSLGIDWKFDYAWKVSGIDSPTTTKIGMAQAKTDGIPLNLHIVLSTNSESL